MKLPATSLFTKIKELPATSSREVKNSGQRRNAAKTGTVNASPTKRLPVSHRRLESLSAHAWPRKKNVA